MRPGGCSGFAAQCSRLAQLGLGHAGGSGVRDAVAAAEMLAGGAAAVDAAARRDRFGIGAGAKRHAARASSLQLGGRVCGWGVKVEKRRCSWEEPLFIAEGGGQVSDWKLRRSSSEG